jgi:hypothetical protein
MKEFVKVDKIFEYLYKQKVRSLIDRITFAHILMVWLAMIVVFGFVYYIFTNETTYLFYGMKDTKVYDIFDAIYFSFVSATTTGFGDIIPLGWFKLISIIEVVSGLMLLAVVTSKLVSIKQDSILNELYELSFTDRVNKLRSSLLLFRQNLDRIISKMEEGEIRKRDTNTIYIYLSSLEDTLRETLAMMEKPTDKNFIKGIDPVNMELIYNSIIHSFEKINEIISVFNSGRMEWRSELNIKLLEECVILNEKLFGKLNLSEKIMKSKLDDINYRKNEVLGLLKSELNKQKNGEKTISLAKFTNGDKEA